RQILVDTLTEYELPQLTTKMLALSEPCVCLRTRQAAVAVGRSKIGGDPDLPAETAWPAFEGQPMVFLAQLDLAELAACLPSPLPSSGLLSFFFDRSTLGQDEGRVLYTRESVERRPAQIERFEECGLELVLSTSVPAVGNGCWAYDDLLGIPALTDD